MRPRKQPTHGKQPTRAGLVGAGLAPPSTFARASAFVQATAGKSSDKSAGIALSELWLPLALAAIAGAAMLLQVWVYQQTISLAYAISDLRAAQAHLLIEKTDLELKLAGLKTPKQLITAAMTVHDLHSPRADQIITVTATP